MQDSIHNGIGSVIAPVGLISPILDVVDQALLRSMPSSGLLNVRWVDTMPLAAKTSSAVQLCLSMKKMFLLEIVNTKIMAKVGSVAVCLGCESPCDIAVA